MSEKLKGCPFCGRVPAMTGWGVTESARAIECENDDCAANPMVVGDTEARAVARWNGRAVVEIGTGTGQSPYFKEGDLVRVTEPVCSDFGMVGHVVEVRPTEKTGFEVYVVRTTAGKKFYLADFLAMEVEE